MRCAKCRDSDCQDIGSMPSSHEHEQRWGHGRVAGRARFTPFQSRERLDGLSLGVWQVRWSSYFPQRRIAPKETTVSQATAETITVGQLGVRFLVEGPDSNGSVSVFECYVPANARMPAPHSHDAFEETIYGLKGTTLWTLDGESVGIGAGEALCVPRGAVHGFQNGGDTDATFLAIASPGVFGPAYFREVGEVLAASPGGPPDVAALAEVMRRHGLTPAQPATT
jgi:quercetin dioxygenase-like cupin family protein